MTVAGGLAFPKPKTARSEKYLRWIRTHKCLVFHDCRGPVQAAHLNGKRGMGIKTSDFFAVPLCDRHHKQQHTLGIATFAERYRLDLWRECAELMEAWLLAEVHCAS